jgi:hypothetical protein
MFKYIHYYAVLALCWGLALPVLAQEETSCDPTAGLPVAQGEVLFNYGSSTNAFSFTNRSDFTVGQPLVGRSIAQNYITEYGFWARFLLPPQPPVLMATQGDFPDRIQLMWNTDPLSSKPTEGFIIKRDGAFLAQVDAGTNQFIDFNVQAGEFYEYSVNGRNQFGTGSPGIDVGFVNPNGVVTGKIETFSGNAVANAIVTLEPTIGKAISFNGAGDYLCVSHTPMVPTDMWTLAGWLKIGDTHDSDGIVDLGSDLNKNYWLKTTPAGMGKGIMAGVGDGTAGHEITYEFEESPDDWHHVAAVFSGGQLLLYVDGMFKGSMSVTIESEPALFTMGANRTQTNFFDGLIDDMRLYNRPLTQTEIILTKDITASSAADGLVAYWKFDEGLGRKAFDISPNGMDAFINGASFAADTPDILNAGMTDGGGYYIIEGINYSEEQTFQAKAQKSFYNHFSIEYNSAFEACTNLTAFDLADNSTVEISVHPFDLLTRQTILSQDSNFELYLESGNFYLMVNGTDMLLGAATADFQHLALTLDGSTGTVTYFRNGTLENTLNGYSLAGDFSASPWQLAAKGGSTPTDFYTGLIDEVAFFDTLVSQANIQIHASPIVGEGIESGIDAGDANLIAYFPLDEGEGTEVDDYGPNMTGTGEVKNATFSIIAYRQLETPHEFRPSERVVNLNASATAIGNIDFVDESTVTIAGVIRFSETFCYQDSVELLVNGAPSFPPIITDEEGRFVGDFEPGSDIILTPLFRDTTHTFSPPFYETRNLNRPIAGVLFQNTTKREVEGQMAGGACRLSINFLDAPARVKIAALNGCYEQEQEITNLAGDYSFTNLPPVPMAVSIVYHPDNTIYQDFQLQGGQETDLRLLKADTIDFIYTSPPNVEIEPFDNYAPCGDVAFIDQSTPQNGYREYVNDIRVFESYKDEKCYLDSFLLTINNNIAEAQQYSVEVADTTTFPLTYWAGPPNLGGDYTKFLQVTATTPTGAATEVENVVVLGERSRESTFTTASPAIPLIILRDPPGDGSSATLSAGSTNCTTWSNASMVSVADNFNLNLDLGTKIITYAGSPVGGVIMENENAAEVDFSASITETVSTESSLEFCVTTETEYSTSDGDNILFEDADLYVGAAVNFEFSATDVLQYDFENCEFVFDQSFRVVPDGFETKYVYSQWQIETDVIPSLELIGDETSAQAWRDIIARNEETKEQAIFKENITFDGLVSVTETLTTEETNSSSFSFDLEITAGFQETLGFEVFDVGSKVTVGFETTGGTSTSESTSNTSSNSVSYTLADDDPNDNFTIDIFDEGVYGTPVFKIRSGESMCPWEEGTLNREEVGFASDALTAVNVPANDAAVFRLSLTNLGQTGNDPLIYNLGLVEGSNSDGAALIVDGDVLIEPRSFQILPFETIELLLAIERGPEAYSYQDIGVFMASECMWEHSRGLGYDLSYQIDEIDPETGEIIPQGPYKMPSDLAKFYKELRFNVDFIEPCTPIDISFPMQDWVVTPADNERILITLSDYLYDDPDLDVVRVQYRPTGGDGSWINIVELPASEFANDPVFKIVEWDMVELQDGPYDIRAVSQCSDVSLNPGISRVIQGRKETQPPQLFGTPKPADGVLNPGDEISITFTKRIQCDEIFQADGIGTNINYNNLALVDVATGTLIDAIITCQGDKIVVVPNVANQYIENRVLRVVTNDIKDFYGNETDEIAWEFFVNRSNLYWDGGGINEMIQEGNTLTVTREIRNQGGAITSYSIEEVPDWMQVFPRQGSLAPGTRQVVNFEFPADLLVDIYETTLLMETVDGDEPLDVSLRVNCEGPDWFFDPTAYNFSMNLTVELDIEGDISADRVDRIAAFVGGELRGLAYVQYNEALDVPGSGLNPYLAFLTVYSNEVAGETVEFQIWDASDCVLYGSTIESFTFEPDGLVGSPLEPQTIHTDNQILKKIYLHPGWNWISYNVDLMDNSTNGALSSLTNPAGGLIKGQVPFSQYLEVTDSWVGSLTDLSHLTMYQYRSMTNDSLLLVGAPVDPTTPININVGWNWLGFLPLQGLPVSDALGSLNPLNGDIVKGQFTFAQYVAGVGWIGNLNFMSSPNGYLLKISNAGTLVYPNDENGNDPFQGLTGSRGVLTSKNATQKLVSDYWEVDPGAYEFSMNMIAIVEDVDGYNMLSDGDEVAAFVDDELRGSSKVMYVEELGVHLIFLTIYANQEGETVNFKLYEDATGEEYPLVESFSFLINTVIGAAEAPTALHLEGGVSTSAGELPVADNSFRIYPNPAQAEVYLNFSATVGEQVEIRVTDALGRVVDQFETTALSVNNILQWSPKGLADGLYFVTLRQNTNSTTLKLEIKGKS